MDIVIGVFVWLVGIAVIAYIDSRERARTGRDLW